jgi:3-oxoacyl-[acyl-carrier-protein] synthase II
MDHVADVVITAMGVVSAAGLGAPALWDALAAQSTCVEAGSVCVDEVCEQGVYGGFVRAPLPGRGEKGRRAFNREAALLVAATEQAAESSRLCEIAPERIGASMGSRHAGHNEFLGTFGAQVAFGPGLVSPTQAVNSIHNAPAARVAMQHRHGGPSLTLIGDDTAGIVAIRQAARLLRLGAADVVVAGGVDVIRCTPWAGEGWAATPAPFDRDRVSDVPGEAGVALVMELRSHALARGVRPLVSVGAGYAAHVAARSDGDEVSGHAARVSDVLARAGGSLGGVVSSARGARGGDARVARTLGRALGGAAAETPVCAFQGAVGHVAAAAGALGVVLAVLALEHGELPATVGFRTRDPELPELFITSRRVKLERPQVLVEVLAERGHGAALVIERDGD